MNERFDPQRVRTNLLNGPVGITRYLALDFEEYRTNHALNGAALTMKCTGIKCCLVGLDEAGVAVLEKTKYWVEKSIELGEIPDHYYSKYGDEAVRLLRLALCRWLLYGKHDQEVLDEAARFNDAYLESMDAEYRRAQVEVSIVGYLDARWYARGIELYELEDLPRLTDLARIRTECQMAYVLCKQRLQRTYPDAEVKLAVRKFLSKNVATWLGEGQYPTVAVWMKLTAWEGAEVAESARRALLCCYGYLRGLKRPSGDG
jgi:hypothetical protein